MKKIINEFIRANYSVIKQNFINTSADAKIGISGAERLRILKKENVENGKTTIFGENFHYTSATAMLHSLDELFLQDIYKFKTENPYPYIIDCGANMGLSIIYFKKMFPNAIIDAFEPDSRIFEVLKKNVEPYNKERSIQVYDKAVWTEETTLQFQSDGGLSGKIVNDSETQTIKIETVDLKKFLEKPVDFLKIDIEGAENELIFDLKGHLDQVKLLFLEYHGILGQPQNLGEILNLLKEEGFQYYIRLAGETIRYPFCNEEPKYFNQQLNILCYRKL